MAEVFKRLATKGYVYSVDTEYSPPEGSSSVISSIMVSPDEYNDFPLSIHVFDSGNYNDSNIIYKNYNVKGGEPLMLEPGITLGPSQSLFIPSPGAVCAISVFGSETSGFTGYKILGQDKPASNLQSIIYRNFNSTTTITRSVVVCNTSSDTDDLINIGISDRDTFRSHDYIAGKITIKPEETIILSSKYPIESDYRFIVQSENGTSTFTLFGVEYADN